MLPRWSRAAWIGPAAFLTAFLVVPLLAIGRQTWSAHAWLTLTSTEPWRIASLAAIQALLSTALALLIGLPIANVVSRYRFHGRALLQAIATVPFVLPTVVVALAVRSLIGEHSGLLVVVLAHAYVNIAVVVRIVGSRWAQHDARYEVVGRTLGSSSWRSFWSVTVPMLRASIVSSAAVVFVFSFSSLGIVLLLGDSTTRTLELTILRQTSLLLDFPGAAASAVIQLVVVSVVLLATARASSRSPREQLVPARLLPLPWRRPARVTVLAVAVVATVIIATPLLALVRASLTENGQLTFAFWHALASIDAGTTRIGSPLAALATSLWFAIATALVAGVIGGMAAIAILSPGTGRLVALASMAPLGISAATIGLGTMLAFGRPPLDLRSSGLLVPLAHALVAVPLVVAVASPALASADRRLVTVAASLGATNSRAFWTAYGPILRVVMLAAAGLAAAVSLGEFGAASFLARAGNPTVPLQIVRLLSRPGAMSFGVAAVLCVILVVMTVTLVLLVDRSGRHWQQEARA